MSNRDLRQAGFNPSLGLPRAFMEMYRAARAKDWITPHPTRLAVTVGCRMDARNDLRKDEDFRLKGSIRARLIVV